MWWFCEVPTVGCEVEKMFAPAGPDHEAQNNTANCYDLGSLVQWVSLLSVYRVTALRAFNLRSTDDWNTRISGEDS